MSAEDRYFCSVQSRQNGEEVFGTVARIRSWFLLEYPGVWRRNAVEDSRLLPPSLRQHLRGPRYDRALLIRQEHCRTGPIRAFVVDSSPERPSMSRYELDDYERAMDIDGPGEPLRGYMLAVCTHSRHDACCAKFGNPVWCALRDLAPDRAWQCSHVGGDRFAANVVLFPHGIYYGRVLPEDLPELLRACDAGQIWMRGFRGRSCYGRAVQIAEYFLRRETGMAAFDDFRPAGRPERDGDLTAVVFESTADSFRLRVEYRSTPDAFRQRLTCESSEESPVAQHELLSITTVD